MQTTRGPIAQLKHENTWILKGLLERLLTVFPTMYPQNRRMDRALHDDAWRGTWISSKSKPSCSNSPGSPAAWRAPYTLHRNNPEQVVFGPLNIMKYSIIFKQLGRNSQVWGRKVFFCLPFAQPSMQEKIVRLLATSCLNGMRMAGSIHCIPLPYVTCSWMFIHLSYIFQTFCAVSGASWWSKAPVISWCICWKRCDRAVSSVCRRRFQSWWRPAHAEQPQPSLGLPTELEDGVGKTW